VCTTAIFSATYHCPGCNYYYMPTLQVYNVMYRYRDTCSVVTESVTEIGFYPYEIAENSFIYLSVFAVSFSRGPISQYVYRTFGTGDFESQKNGGRRENELWRNRRNVWHSRRVIGGEGSGVSTVRFHYPPSVNLIDLIACRLNTVRQAGNEYRSDRMDTEAAHG